MILGFSVSSSTAAGHTRVVDSNPNLKQKNYFVQ